jgi:hypothetical protein
MQETVGLSLSRLTGKPLFTLSPVVLLLAQLSYHQWQRRSLPLVGPVTGERLPVTAVRAVAGGGDIDLSWLLSSEGSCAMLVVINTGCAICMRMRYTWPNTFRTWSDSVDAPVKAVWLSGQSQEANERFYRGINFRDINVVRTSGSARTALRRLGVYGTPTLYLTDRFGRLRVGVAGDQLPAATDARSICSE